MIAECHILLKILDRDREREREKGRDLLTPKIELGLIGANKVYDLTCSGLTLIKDFIKFKSGLNVFVISTIFKKSKTILKR